MRRRGARPDVLLRRAAMHKRDLVFRISKRYPRVVHYWYPYPYMYSYLYL